MVQLSIFLAKLSKFLAKFPKTEGFSYRFFCARISDNQRSGYRFFLCKISDNPVKILMFAKVAYWKDYSNFTFNGKFRKKQFNYFGYLR